MKKFIVKLIFIYKLSYKFQTSKLYMYIQIILFAKRDINLMQKGIHINYI